MTIAVKLVRLKSRAKTRGRPKYRYVLRWRGTDGWQQESCRTADRGTAAAIRQRKFVEVNGLVDAASNEPEPEVVTWDELNVRTKASLKSRGKADTTSETYCRSIRTFRDLSGIELPADVTSADIEQFIATRREQENRPATVNKDLRQLRRVFNLAVRRDDLASNPFREFEKLEEDELDIRTLSNDELIAIWSHFADQPLLQTFIMVSLQTGCRIGEIMHWTRDDIEPSTGWLMIRNKTLPDGTLWKPKSKASVRDVWIPPWLMQRLTALRLGRKPFVWSRHVANLGRAFDEGFNPKRFIPFAQHQISGCCLALGIPRFTHHDLRRTQQTRLQEKGWGDAICLAIAGQNTGATVLRNHYWRPNHRRMTLPAFEDMTSIFSEAKLVEGDPLGDTCRLKSELERSDFVVSHVG